MTMIQIVPQHLNAGFVAAAAFFEKERGERYVVFKKPGWQVRWSHKEIFGKREVIKYIRGNGGYCDFIIFKDTDEGPKLVFMSEERQCVLCGSKTNLRRPYNECPWPKHYVRSICTQCITTKTAALGAQPEGMGYGRWHVERDVMVEEVIKAGPARHFDAIE